MADSPIDIERFREALKTASFYDGEKRPQGNNADEWAIFLEAHRAAGDFIAVQIAEAIDAAEHHAARQISHDLAFACRAAMQRIAHLEQLRDDLQDANTRYLTRARSAEAAVRHLLDLNRDLVALMGDLSKLLKVANG